MPSQPKEVSKGTADSPQFQGSAPIFFGRAKGNYLSTEGDVLLLKFQSPIGLTHLQTRTYLARCFVIRIQPLLQSAV